MSSPTNQYGSYQTKSLWISSGDYKSDQVHPSGLRQLSRIQSMSVGIEYGLQDNVYLDSAVEPSYVAPAGADVTLNWLHTNGRNEWYLGLADVTYNNSASLGLAEEKNLYVTIQDHFGSDAIGAATGSTKQTIGFGQSIMTSYQMSAQVGSLIQSQATLSCLNARIYTGFSGLRTPAVNYQNGAQLTGLFVIPVAQSQYSPDSTDPVENIAAIGAQDMVFMFPVGKPFGVTFTGYESCYLQSFQVGFSTTRNALKSLGYAYPPNRPVLYPIPVDLTTEAIVNKYQADELSRLACTNTGFQINVVVKQPCSNLTMFGLYFTNMQIVSQSFANSIGPADTVTTQWRGWITNPQSSQTQFGTTFNYIVRTDTTGAWGTTW